MENGTYFFLGLIYVLMAFLLSFSICCFIKTFYIAFIRKKTPAVEKKVEAIKLKRERQRVNKIIINPNEINKIYVKKD